MTPRVLFVGGDKGSWQIRGCQMAAALCNARAVVDPERHDWEWADTVILVKRGIEKYGDLAKASGKTVIWDVLDCWRQPEGNQVSVADYATTVREVAKHCGVSTLIGATQAMADVIGGVYIPHHARPKLRARPVREKVEVVAYEGTKKYLGRWLPALTDACQARGWRFVVNPDSLADADIVVAFRDGQWDGEICRQWKSGVKLVNALTAQRPVLNQESAAWWEIAPTGSVLIDASEVEDALDYWTPYERRRQAAEDGAALASAYRLGAIAGMYRLLLNTTAKVAA